MSGMDGQSVQTKLAILRKRFEVGLVDRLDKLQSCWRAQDLELLRREAHNLAGAAATYMYPELATVARDLEKALLVLSEGEPHGAPHRQVTATLDKLSRLIASLRDEA